MIMKAKTQNRLYMSYLVALALTWVLWAASLVTFTLLKMEVLGIVICALSIASAVTAGVSYYLVVRDEPRKEKPDPVKDFVKDYALHEGRKSYEDARRLSEEIEENR